MAIKGEGDFNSKNLKTLLLRKLLDEEKGKVTLLWVPRHGVPYWNMRK
jgi:hypothetical protein